MRFVLTLILVFLMAGHALAQQPPVDQYMAVGKTFTITALDTLHSSFSKASGVAAAKWAGPRSVLIPRYLMGDPSYSSGDWASVKAMPSGWFLYAKSPFRFKALFPAGDSTGVATVQIDTVITTAPHGVAGRQLFQCFYHLKAPISQLRVVPTTSDTVRAVPLYIPVASF